MFVDDGPGAVQALWPVLAGREDVWSVTFAGTGVEAMESLREQCFDVVVCNLTLADMNGADVLNFVQEDTPNTLRVIQSSPEQREDALLVRAAQLYLVKPCDPAALENLIQRAGSLNEQLGSLSLRRLVGQMGQLPSVPRVYSELSRVMDDPASGAEEIAEVMRRDVALTAKVLQIVNSSFFSLSQTVTDVRQAVACLGQSMVRNMVLSASLYSKFNTANASCPFDPDVFQAHAHRTAAVAQSLMDDSADRADAFTAGILHDTGKLVIASCMPVQSGEIFALGLENPQHVHLNERAILGVCHAEIGGFLLKKWGLPYTVVEAVTQHHDPDRAPQLEFDLIAATHLADSLVSTWEWEAGLRSTHEVYYPNTDALHRLGVAHRISEWREEATRICTRTDLSLADAG